MHPDYMAAWRKANKSKILAYKREWGAKNKDKVSRHNKKCRVKDLERTRMRDRKFNLKYKNHIEELRLLREYGLTIEQHRAMVVAQNGMCAICENPGSLCIDHCHKTGNVRGLLCRQCNTALGMSRDRIDLLEKMIVYLKKQEKKEHVHA